MTGEEVLALKMLPENEAEVDTIKDYLKKLLETLWEEGEGFSGKRPFGNSGWHYDLYATLICGKAVKGKLDEYGQVEELNEKEKDKADKLIFSAIEAL